MEEKGMSWWVARTRHGSELKVRNQLSALGVKSFVPTRMRRSSRGKGMVEEPLLNSMIFLRATKVEALDLIHFRRVMADYMFDYARHAMMSVMDKEMEDFRKVFDLSRDEGGLVDVPLSAGEQVRVMRGALSGVEGHILEYQGHTYVDVSLMNCLHARAKVPRAWLEKI